MRSNRQDHSHAGFTLFELLVVIALISIMATMATPNFLRLIQRSKLTGIAQETSLLMRMARDYAIRYNTETVVRIDVNTNEVIAFVEVDGVLPGDPGDRIFNPIAGSPHRSTDWELARYQLPSRVTFDAPAADPLVGGGTPIWAFTPVAGENVAVFQPNGSADTTGSLSVCRSLRELSAGPGRAGGHGSRADREVPRRRREVVLPQREQQTLGMEVTAARGTYPC